MELIASQTDHTGVPGSRSARASQPAGDIFPSARIVGRDRQGSYSELLGRPVRSDSRFLEPGLDTSILDHFASGIDRHRGRRSIQSVPAETPSGDSKNL